MLRINECKDSDFNENTDMLRERFKTFNTNRNLQIWQDGSIISNHSHLLMAVNTLYDIAIHMSDQEFQKRFGKTIDVHAEIEKPDVYILARCPSDDHQLMYSDSRNEDIRLLKHSIDVEGSQLHDSIRFFHGDGTSM